MDYGSPKRRESKRAWGGTLSFAACVLLGLGCPPATVMYAQERVSLEMNLPPAGVVTKETLGRSIRGTSPVDRRSPPPEVQRGWRTVAIALPRVQGPLAVFPSFAAERSGAGVVLYFSGTVLGQEKGGNETPFAIAYVKARARRLRTALGKIRYFETGRLDGEHTSDVCARLKKGLEDSDDRIRRFSALLLGRVAPDEAEKLAKAHPALAEELAAYRGEAKSLDAVALDAAERVHPVGAEPAEEKVPLLSP